MAKGRRTSFTSSPFFAVFLWITTFLTINASSTWEGFWKGYEPIKPWDEAWSASTKFNILAAKMDAAIPVSAPFYSYLELLRNLGAIPLVPSVDMEKLMERSTFRPPISDRKTLHTQGTYGRVRVEWAPGAKQYSGVFQDDVSPYAVLNYSNGFRLPQVSNFFGISLNIFRSGVNPAGVLTAFNFFSVPNWNMFDYMHCNHYEWIYGLPLLPFSMGPAGNAWTNYFSMMGISDLGTADTAGNLYNKVKTPFALCFRPVPKLQAEFDGFPPYKHNSELLQFVEPGTHMYELIAVTEAEALLDPSREAFMEYTVKVADIYLGDTPFSRCEWCDTQMWVRHTTFEEDLAFRPDWAPIATNINYLIRTGPVGIYQHIMPPAQEDTKNYHISLQRYSDRLITFLSSNDGFKELLRILGVTPKQLKDDQLMYLLKLAKTTGASMIAPNHYPIDEVLPYPGPMVKISPRWVWRLSKNFGEPMINYWKGLGLLVKSNYVPTLANEIPIDRAVRFANDIVLRMNHYYDDPNIGSRYRNLLRFLRYASPLLTNVHSRLCEVFSDNMLFVDCGQAREWLMEQSCLIYVLSQPREGILQQEIATYRLNKCLEDPPEFYDLPNVNVQTTLFADAAELKWPDISQSYLSRLAEGVAKVKALQPLAA